MRARLPLLIRQFLTHDLANIDAYRSLVQRWYMPHAVFDYPLAHCEGRDAIAAFWDVFLIGRKLQMNDVHSLKVDVLWDAEQLQAFVQIQSWQHITPLKWLDHLFRAPGWKVWSTQLFQFQDSSHLDGPGALRIGYQQELTDEFVFLGLLPLGIFEIKADPGTPLHAVLTTLRRAVSWSMQASVWALEPLTQLVAGALKAAAVAAPRESADTAKQHHAD